MFKFFKRIKILLSFLKANSKEKESPPFLIKSENQIVSKGKHSYHNGNFIVKGKGGVLEIGSFCAIGADVKVILSNHDQGFPSMQYTFYAKYFGKNPFSNNKMITTIGNDVWIGDNVVILPGVKIGTGAILAANAIVTKDVDPYSIVGGNPAKLIKKRFSDNKIQELLDMKWWEWDTETIKRNEEFFFKNHK
ncbi:CatB-related O-acetyltransferase [Aequorivita sediminis]|uniref:CatB-related O-acetyltransferase n=1 Tax=Aequorivita sediminis TaxID=3073653 RepID=UPI0028B05429|nr:CatB-related O-acetyltransferase [Aequorivita sp. F6058]